MPGSSAFTRSDLRNPPHSILRAHSRWLLSPNFFIHISLNPLLRSYVAPSTQTKPIYTTLSRLYPSIGLPTSLVLFYSFSLSRPTLIRFLKIISPPLLPSTESLRRLHLYSLLRPFSSPSALGHQLVALFAAPSFKRDSTRLERHCEAPAPLRATSPPARASFPRPTAKSSAVPTLATRHSFLTPFARNVGHSHAPLSKTSESKLPLARCSRNRKPGR